MTDFKESEKMLTSLKLLTKLPKTDLGPQSRLHLSVSASSANPEG